MNFSMLPANISLIQLTDKKLAALSPVTSLDIFEGSTQNIHPEGLFSVPIFGPIGSPARDNNFAYIPIKITVLHPVVYKNLVKLKGLYGSIISGKAYARWSEEENDFITSDELNGETGYYFFMKHRKKLVFKRTGSDSRDLRIRLIEKTRDICEYDKILVIPAGLRDIHIDEANHVEQDEINGIYRALIGIGNTIGQNMEPSPILDVSRNALQNQFNKLYDYIRNLIEGKKGFLQGKWASRRIFNGTRNVITAMDTTCETLGQPNSPKYNNTVIGLHQLSVASGPFARYFLKTGWLSKVFGADTEGSYLVNPKTLKKELVYLDSITKDRWTRTDGYAKIIASQGEREKRHRPIMIDGYYLGLVYTDDVEGGRFRVFNDIDELPDNYDRANVHPMTLEELIYISGYKKWNKMGLYVTRYPIEGDGSCYPSFPYVKTTIIGRCLREMDENWQLMEGDEYLALEFPTPGMTVYHDSLVPHVSRYKGMGADNDGDMCSANASYSDDGIKEVTDFLKSKRAYLDSRGGLRASPINDTVAYVLYNLTGEPRP